MSTPGAAKSKEVEAIPRLVDPQELVSRGQEIIQRIAQRAFELFEVRGRGWGQDLDDWFKAESELLHPTNLKLTETDRTVSVQLDVLGFEPGDIRVSIEPSQVTVLGGRTTEEKRKTEKTSYSESRSNQIYRVIGLPAEVRTRNAKTTLKNGVLEIELQKPALPEKSRGELKPV
jgi:HSP20 family protein